MNNKALFNINIPMGVRNIDSNSVFVFSIRESNEVNHPILQKISEEENANLLKMDIIQGLDSSNTEIENKLIDFSIVLADDRGEKVSFLLSNFSFLQNQLKVAIMKTAYFINDFKSTPMLQTYSFPLKEIMRSNLNFNYNKITNVYFVFNKTKKGVIVVDNIGFK